MATAVSAPSGRRRSPGRARSGAFCATNDPLIVCLTLELRKAPKGGTLHPLDERANRVIAMVRARVGHPFRNLKRQLGYLKTRYHGLARNRAQLFTLFAPGNLFLVRRRLMA